ncbi:hypothetical protein A1QO_04160 [Vibrio genomosp. F10 str. ZF-129]|uniref:Uncharacterized protein n=1 Tax=Vibrio genomosp. F10 str. ZF-129 TaxID=1187848 RepID=A0A1E5BIP2_9VIBR|nr:hypothetical protein [Vibrio genomosp. F10]OEE37306.1 hypothetical protein A1QO_04160 [Vibrio genomosp. F10 str. ZF-129]
MTKPILVLSCPIQIRNLIKQHPESINTFHLCVMTNDGLLTYETYAQKLDVGLHDVVAPDLYAQNHKRQARKLLCSLSDGRPEHFVILEQQFLECFMAIAGNTKKKQTAFLTELGPSYICDENLPPHELEIKLQRVISYASKQAAIGFQKEIYYRSGISNGNEMGFVQAGCAVGTSLARVSSESKADLFSDLLYHADRSPLFVDNGLIRFFRQGVYKSTEWVFEQYRNMIVNLPSCKSKNISIVIPDDPLCPDNALQTVIKHKEDITWLRKRCSVILPIHRCTNIQAQAHRLMKVLNYPVNIRLGIPCLNKKDTDFRLTIGEIDKLMSLRNPKGGKLFNEIHYFAMSDVTAKNVLEPRLLLANLHGYEGNAIHLDCCRIGAIFGKTKNGLLKGSQLQNDILQEHEDTYTKYLQDLADNPTVPLSLKKETNEYISTIDKPSQHGNDRTCVNTHNAIEFASLHSLMFEDDEKESNGNSYDEEFHDDRLCTHFTDDFYNLINEDEIWQAVALYNLLLQDYQNLQLPTFEKGEEEEAVNILMMMVGQRSVDTLLYEQLKKVSWQELVKEMETLSPDYLRLEVFSRMFKEPQSNSLQMGFNFTAKMKKCA